MSCVSAEVKRWLQTARTEKDKSAVHEAFKILQTVGTGQEGQTNPRAPSELFVLCCEEAIALQMWEVADQCIPFFIGHMTCTRLLQARSFFCEGELDCHRLPTDSRGADLIEERHACASTILRGITIAVEEWPRDSWVVVAGIQKLWSVLEPLYQARFFKSVVDLLGFVVSLHEKLMIGGAYTQVQWITRYATCLRGIGRVPEALAQLNIAVETATKVGNDRLQVQLLRQYTITAADREPSANKGGKQESTTFRHLFHQAVQLSQSFLCGNVDAHAARAELLVVHDKLRGAHTAEKDPVPTKPTKSKSKTVVPESVISDPQVMEEVLSDVVLCLAMLNEGARCEESLKRLLASVNTRPRTFGLYASILLRAHADGLIELLDAQDASYMTSTMEDKLLHSLQEVELIMDGARMIIDSAERVYTLQVGCCILWNFCLPLMQDTTHHLLRRALTRIVKELRDSDTCPTGFLVRAEYESSLAEFNEDNLSLVKEQIHRALSRWYAVAGADGSVSFPMDFPLLWLQRRTQLRSETDSSFTSSAEMQALFNVEQAKMAGNTSPKRLLLLKAAYNKLPPLVPEMPTSTSPMEPEKTLERSGILREPNSRDAKKPKASPSPVMPPPKLSLAHLYLTLLVECVREENPGLQPIAKITATALSSMEVEPEERHADYLLMKAKANLVLARVLIAEDGTTAPDGAPVDEARHEAEVFKCLKEAAELGHTLQGFGLRTAWLTINSCKIYMSWRSPRFSVGQFAGTSTQLSDLFSIFSRMKVDYDREHRVMVDLSLMLCLALVQDFIRVKGEVAQELSPTSYEDFMSKAYAYSRPDSSSPILKRAHDVAWEVMQRISLPALKHPMILFFPCICRLQGGKIDNVSHPQDQLLILLGRMAGPMPPEERRTLLMKDALDLLRHDPSVQLCGRVAMQAVDLKNERLVLDVCQIADKLYVEEMLGWGTLYPPPPANASGGPNGEKENGGKSSSSSSSKNNHPPPPPAVPPRFPKPTQLDWMWYAKLQLHQALIYDRWSHGIDHESKEKLGTRVLLLCTNSAIAASHGPPTARAIQIRLAISLYVKGVSQLWKNRCNASVIIPSLKMLLSKHLLRFLDLSTGDKRHDQQPSTIKMVETICHLGLMLARLNAERGAYREGMDGLLSLMQVLPSAYHKRFKSLEVQFSCKLGLDTAPLLRTRKSDDSQTDAFAWISLARHTQNHDEAMEAWKIALTIVDKHNFAKASLLLTMAEHLARKNRINQKDLIVMLRSALDVIEAFDTIVNPSYFNTANVLTELADSRARIYPSHLIGTLTGRTLLLTMENYRDTKGVQLLKKNIGVASLKDVMLAIRIVFFLFKLSPTHQPPPQPSSSENVPAAATSSSSTSSLTRRECAVLMLHYVDCLWRIAASSVSMQAEQAGMPLPITLPSNLSDWFGFFFDDSVVELLRLASPADAEHNTSSFQGILLELIDYALGAGMEQYTFMVVSWTHLAACWRFGSQDVRSHAVQRAVYGKARVAAVRCGAGGLSYVYHLQPPTPKFWTQVEETLSEERRGMERDMTDIFFSPHLGSLQDVLLREAETLRFFGHVESSALIAEMVVECARRLEDWDGVAKCIRFKGDLLEIHDKKPKALQAMLDFEEAHYLLHLSPKQWVDWQLRKVQLLCHVGDLKELSVLVISVHAGIQKFGTGCLSHTVAAELGKMLRSQLQQRFDYKLVFFLSGVIRRSPLSIQPAPIDAQSLSDLFYAAVDRLKASHHWRYRFAATLSRALIRQQVGWMWLADGRDMEEAADLLALLAREAEEVEELLHTVRAEIRCSAPMTTETTEAPLRYSQLPYEATLLRIKAQNELERLRIVHFTRRAYRHLTMEELNIPGGGPQHLEKYVLQFMRDPTRSATDAGENYSLTAEWSRPIAKMPEETKNAFHHYGLSLGQAGAGAATRYGARATLYTAAEISSGGGSTAFVDAAMCLLETELQSLLEAELDESDAPKDMISRMSDLLDEHWSCGPLTVVDGKHNSKKKERTRSRRDNGGDEVPIIAPTVLTEKESFLLDVVFGVIQAAQFRLDYAGLARCYGLLGHLYMLWKRPQAAGWAVEFAQAATVSSYLVDSCFSLMENTAEARAWRTLQLVLESQPEVVPTKEFAELRASLMAASPMLQRLDLAAAWPSDPESVNQAPVDGVVLSIVRCQEGSSHFLVALRHPEGGIDCRRRKLNLDEVRQVQEQFRLFEHNQKQKLLHAGHPASAKDPPRTTADDAAPILTAVEAVLGPLWADFADILSFYHLKTPLYLCLDPILQPLPMEHLPCFANFTNVMKELSTTSILKKLQVKAGKTGSNYLCVVDPYGENNTAMETLFGPEPTSNSKKASANIILSNTTGFPFTPEYMSWLLESPTQSAVLYDLCGPLTILLPTRTLVSLQLEHLQTVAVIADGINESSIRREQKSELTKHEQARCRDSRWSISLMMLARGVRLLGMNTFPSSPAANDLLSRRILPVLASGRGLVDLVSTAPVKNREVRRDFISIYGVCSLPSKTKP